MNELGRFLAGPFAGLSREVWWLAFITLINRAGTMVVPFLSIYLTKDLGFSLSDVGWIMTSFGLGSVAGSWLGGKLTDRFGYYPVMAGSLLLSGFLFISLQWLTGYWAIVLGVFLVILVADTSRPATFVALSTYSKPENRTRSVTLIRLAINLGFTAGPALGGLLIINTGYAGLFWVDGITFFVAVGIFVLTLDPRKSVPQEPPVKLEQPASPYRDGLYWIFIVAMALYGFVFLQFFSTVPMFYEGPRGMSEDEIGLLMGMNGLVIFILEMPLVKWLERSAWNKLNIVNGGVVLLALSFLLMNAGAWIGMLVISMLAMTVGEMLAFPFSNAFAMDRAKRGNQGEYLALYSIAFSLSHVFGHNSGMQLVDRFGYEFTWYVMAGLCLVAMGLMFYLKHAVGREQTGAPVSPDATATEEWVEEAS